MGKPCRGCGKPKPAGRGVLYCDACREERSLPAWERNRYKQKMIRARTMTGHSNTRAMAKAAPVGMKWCSGCGDYLPLVDFQPRGASRPLPRCTDCRSRYQHERKVLRYGIDPDRYDSLLAQQGGACAICGTHPRQKRLAVDHNHKTGEVRGLLCGACNHGVLGKSRESTRILQAAIDYLENPPSRRDAA